MRSRVEPDLIPIGLIAFPVISVGYRLTHANSDDPWIGPLTSVKLLVAWTMYGLFVALGLIDEIGMSEPTAELARETSIWDLKDILG